MTTSKPNEKREQLVLIVPLNTIFVAHMKEIMDFEYERNYGHFSQQRKTGWLILEIYHSMSSLD